jgi:hypothetical protein
MLRVTEIVDDSVGIAIEGAATLVVASLGGWWCSLLCLDEIGSALERVRNASFQWVGTCLMIQGFGFQDIIIDDFDIHATL